MKLFENPFHILNCSPEDNKSFIYEQKDIKSFEIDEKICEEAVNILISPSKRIEAEISWFLAFNSSEINKKINQILSDSNAYINDLLIYKTNNYLDEANLLAFAIENIKYPKECEKDDIRLCISFLCMFSEKITLEYVRNLIITERKKSNFSTNINDDDLRFFIQNQKKFYKEVINSFLNKINLENYYTVLSLITEDATNKGNSNCKWQLLEQIIYDYELDNKHILVNNINEINKNITYIKEVFLSGNFNEKNIEQFINEIEMNLKIWIKLVKPIILLKTSRGQNHELSEDVFISIRDLCLTVANKLQQYVFALRIVKLLKIYFCNLRRIIEIAERDDQELSYIIGEEENKKYSN